MDIITLSLILNRNNPHLFLSGLFYSFSCTWTLAMSGSFFSYEIAQLALQWLQISVIQMGPSYISRIFFPTFNSFMWNFWLIFSSQAYTSWSTYHLHIEQEGSSYCRNTTSSIGRDPHSCHGCFGTSWTKTSRNIVRYLRRATWLFLDLDIDPSLSSCTKLDI